MLGTAQSVLTTPRSTAALVVTRGPGVTSPVEVPLTATTVIGRHPGCDIVLDDMTISRRHAELRHVGPGFAVTDLGSLNGTYLNRKPVRHELLADGDVLWIGRFRLEFRSAPPLEVL